MWGSNSPPVRSKGRDGGQAEKFAEKLFCFSISYRVGLIARLKSVICLSQKRANDRFHTAAVLRRAGAMSTHTASRSSPRLRHGKDSGSPKVPACPWRRELRRRAGDWERQPKANRKLGEGGDPSRRGREVAPARVSPPASQIPRKSIKHKGQPLRKLGQLLLFKFNNSSLK